MTPLICQNPTCQVIFEPKPMGRRPRECPECRRVKLQRQRKQWEQDKGPSYKTYERQRAYRRRVQKFGAPKSRLVPLVLLQKCAMILSDVDGITQRLESHAQCCHLDARDRHAIGEARAVHMALRKLLAYGTEEHGQDNYHGHVNLHVLNVDLLPTKATSASSDNVDPNEVVPGLAVP